MTLLGQRDGLGTTIHLSAHKYTRHNYFCRKDHKQRVGPRMSSQAAGKTLSWGMLGDQRCLDKHASTLTKFPHLSLILFIFLSICQTELRSHIRVVIRDLRSQQCQR